MQIWLQEGMFCRLRRRRRRGQGLQSLRPESLNQWDIEKLPFFLQELLGLQSWVPKPLKAQLLSLEFHLITEQLSLVRLRVRLQISLARRSDVQVQSRPQWMRGSAKQVLRLLLGLHPILAHLKLGRHLHRTHKFWLRNQLNEQSQLRLKQFSFRRVLLLKWLLLLKSKPRTLQKPHLHLVNKFYLPD